MSDYSMDPSDIWAAGRQAGRDEAREEIAALRAERDEVQRQFDRQLFPSASELRRTLATEQHAHRATIAQRDSEHAARLAAESESSRLRAERDEARDFVRALEVRIDSWRSLHAEARSEVALLTAALKKCAGVLAGETMSKGALVSALEAARAALSSSPQDNGGES